MRVVFGLLLGLILGLVLSGTGHAVQPPAAIRVVHASPDAPDVDVLVNGGLAFPDVEFGEATGYAELLAGTYNVQVVPAGLTAPVVIDADLFLRPNKDYTVVATGFLSEIQPLVLRDFNNFPPRKLTRVRFVHASPDAPPVDIAVAGGPVLFYGIGFRDWDYAVVQPGCYNLEVRLAGTDIVALSVPGVYLEGGAVYSIFAIGLALPGSGEPPLQALLTLDALSKLRSHPLRGRSRQSVEPGSRTPRSAR